MDCDVLIVGAGILGLSSAFHLKRENPGKRMVVIDKYGGPGQGNSAKSEGGFRNLFSSETNYLLADTTINWFKHIEEMGHNIGLSFIGYLFLLSNRQYLGQKSSWDKIRSRGADMKVLGKEELHEIVPGLVTDFEDNEEVEILGLKPIDYGVFGKKCGSIDADALTRAYENEFLKLGGELNYGTEAKSLILKPKLELDIPGEPFVWQDSHIVGVKTSKGEIRADVTVIATGVWSGCLLDIVGIDALMRPKKRQIFALKDPRLGMLLNVEGFNEHKAMPLTVLPKSGVLFRPELSEGSIWVTCADTLGRKFELEEDPHAEEGYYTDEIYHILSKYFPCFEDVRPINMWAGQYAINSYDELPVVAPYPGMIYIGCASGSGIMKCDSLGRIVAALYAGKEKAELFGGKYFKVEGIGVHYRNVVRESLVI